MNKQSFPSNRYNHCYNVGKRMQQYAKEKGYNEIFCNKMFILGSIHDIGYEINSDSYLHGVVLSELLEEYEFSKEIYHHSKLQLEHDSIAMKLLYLADMTVDGQGNWCTLKERLQDLESRYGRDSEPYIESEKIAKYLIEIGFSDEKI